MELSHGEVPPKIPATNRPTSSRHWAFGGIGVAVGLAIGLTAGLLIPSTISAVATVASNAGPTAIVKAVKSCSVTDSEWITVGDHGTSISMKSEGDESSGADISDVACVLSRLHTPDAVIQQIDATRALDGRQSASWKTYSASWSYHPDDGLDIIIEPRAR